MTTVFKVYNCQNLMTEKHFMLKIYINLKSPPNELLNDFNEVEDEIYNVIEEIKPFSYYKKKLMVKFFKQR